MVGAHHAITSTTNMKVKQFTIPKSCFRESKYLVILKSKVDVIETHAPIIWMRFAIRIRSLMLVMHV
jgi:hypothetical protein